MSDKPGEFWDMVLVFPTWIWCQMTWWLVTRRPDHPWRGRTFTLRDWSLRATDITRGFAIGMWFCLTQLVAIALALAIKRWLHGETR